MSTVENPKSNRLSGMIVQRSAVVLFVALSSLLFIYLNQVQPNYYIDEAFHIPQVQKYCNGTFFEWDKKITTPPGLYVLSTVLLAPIKQCTTLFLRSINLILTFSNLYLTYKILSTKKWARREENALKKFGVAFAVTIFPPLFFWFFLYYTDVLSINLILLTFLLHQREHYNASAYVGGCSVFVRQTNIVWVILLAGERVLTLIEAQTPRSIETLVNRGLHTTPMHAKLLWNNVVHHIRRGKLPFMKFIGEMCSNVRGHIKVLITFLAFVIINKGIVLGDRNAHVATIHVPQLFYFTVFFSVFAWPYVLPQWRSFLQFVRKHWIITSVLLALFTTIVHNNTLVHPYLLADNRHYVFYVWNKIMGRYYLAKYLLVPIYGFSIYGLLACLQDLRYLSKVLYIVSISVILVPQLLLEPRYFVIPYVLLRLNMTEPKPWQLFMELITTALINFLQFYIFVTKSFYWTDQEGPQRISW
ncbi:putative Dol-P-Glc:Glc(2)Man(9)GlcNAc(2)-PP-Dol alpha-1,2-glucosyltransferase [Diachasma alloeum]|uniref:putative Dol-P-Glc:Glc(2)Man(9)GlcNAc(2)-PP-Dol alpha-1,2-glucosyltransferase n=1 Tax=Diachasma alloeum TaxID=454923 RepID=UPI0007384497|nr:putative Dol-P-Glc:Glc(2)Man(9)GlcNAc(2)-PP-Dol alpha-1,2-glucosyltransferase [Diachasma alloeum]